MPQRDMLLNPKTIKEIGNTKFSETINKSDSIPINNSIMNNGAITSTSVTTAQPIIISSSPTDIYNNSNNSSNNNLNVKDDNKNKNYLTPEFLNAYVNKTKNVDSSSPIMIKQPPPPPSALNKFSFQPNHISPYSTSSNNNVLLSSTENVNSFFNPKSAQLSSSFQSDQSNYMKDIKSSSSFISPSSGHLLVQDNNVNLLSSSYQPTSMVHDVVPTGNTSKLSSSLNYKSTLATNPNNSGKNKSKVWFTKGIPISENTLVKSQRMHRKRTMRLTKQAQSDVKLYYKFDINLLLQISVEQWVDFIAVTTFTLWQYPNIELSTHFMANAYEALINSSSQDTSYFLSYRRFLYTFMVKTSPNPFVILHAIVYLYKLKECSPNEIATPRSETFVFPVLVMLADKYIQDVHQLPAKYWAMAAKMKTEDLILFQRKLMKYLGYSLFVSYAETENVVSLIEQFLNEDMDLDHLNQDISSPSSSLSYPTPPISQQNSLDGFAMFCDESKDETTTLEAKEAEKLLRTFKKILKKQNEYIPKVVTSVYLSNKISRRKEEEYKQNNEEDSMDGDDEREDYSFRYDQIMNIEHHDSPTPIYNYNSSSKPVPINMGMTMTKNFNIVNSYNPSSSTRLSSSYPKNISHEQSFSTMNPFTSMSRINSRSKRRSVNSDINNFGGNTFIPVPNAHSSHRQSIGNNSFDNNDYLNYHSYDPQYGYGGISSVQKPNYSMNSTHNVSGSMYEPSVPLFRKDSTEFESYYNGTNHNNSNSNSNNNGKKVSMLTKAMNLLKRNNDDKNGSNSKASKTLPRNYKSSKYNVLSKESSMNNISGNLVYSSGSYSKRMSGTITNRNSRIYNHNKRPSIGTSVSNNSINNNINSSNSSSSKHHSLPPNFNNYNYSYNDMKKLYYKGTMDDSQNISIINKKMDGSGTSDNYLFKDNHLKGNSPQPLLTEDGNSIKSNKPKRKSKIYSHHHSHSTQMNSENIIENSNSYSNNKSELNENNGQDSYEINNNNDNKNDPIIIVGVNDDTKVNTTINTVNIKNTNTNSNINSNINTNINTNTNTNTVTNTNTNTVTNTNTNTDTNTTTDINNDKLNKQKSFEKGNVHEKNFIEKKEKDEPQFIDYNNTVNLLKATSFGDDAIVQNHPTENNRSEMDEDIFNISLSNQDINNSRSSKGSFFFPKKKNTIKSNQATIVEEPPITRPVYKKHHKSSSLFSGSGANYFEVERNKGHKKSESFSKKYYTLGHTQGVSSSNSGNDYGYFSKNEKISMEKNQKQRRSIFLEDEITPSPYPDPFTNEHLLGANHRMNMNKEEMMMKKSSSKHNSSKWYDKLKKVFN